MKNSKQHKVAKVKIQADAVLANKLLSQAFRKHLHTQGNCAAELRPEVKDASLETSFPGIRGSKSLVFLIHNINSGNEKHEEDVENPLNLNVLSAVGSIMLHLCQLSWRKTMGQMEKMKRKASTKPLIAFTPGVSTS